MDYAFSFITHFPSIFISFALDKNEMKVQDLV